MIVDATSGIKTFQSFTSHTSPVRLQFTALIIIALPTVRICVTISGMKTRIHHADCPSEYLEAFGLDPGRVIYFDIETTGFRASTSGLYMIGWASRESDWTITQIMAQSQDEEALLLEQFQAVLKRYDTIIAFNGDRFDIPYLREKYEQIGLGDPFAGCGTVDLYRQIRPFRKCLGLTRLNQKSVEQFLQIPREDPYNGGELIDVYRSVRDHRCDDPSAALDSLFLHNYEDVLGMLAMTKLLAYPAAMESPGQMKIRIDEDAPGIEAGIRLKVPVPKPLEASFCEQCTVSIRGKDMILSLRPLPGCLYHFFPDYRNYYYLPAEDMAIHKSVASFVAPSHREKARAQNCYTKKRGLFIPLAPESAAPVSDPPKLLVPISDMPESTAPEFHAPTFQRYYKDPILWIEWKDAMAWNASVLTDYLGTLMKSAVSGAGTSVPSQ